MFVDYWKQISEIFIDRDNFIWKFGNNNDIPETVSMDIYNIWIQGAFSHNHNHCNVYERQLATNHERCLVVLSNVIFIYLFINFHRGMINIKYKSLVNIYKNV